MLSLNVLKPLFCALVALAYFGAVGAISPKYAVARRQAASRTIGAREIMTNAERLRRGFPPLPPRSLNPTRTGLAPRTPSGISSQRKCIEVKKKGNTGGFPTSYISDIFVPGTGTFGVTNNKNRCLEVLVPSNNGPFSLAIDGENGSERYLGLALRNGRDYVLPVKAAQGQTQDQNSNDSGFGSNNTPSSRSAVWSKNNSDDVSVTWSGYSVTFWMRENPGPANNPKAIYFAINNGYSNDFNDDFEVVLSYVNPTNGN
ncbi:hypothetical protein EST38_g3736 [Candolleomyces aberdarensis]|uniref:Uncharacterized protein n=1 Tax=Candolleomyces aberdarensis TaxID=2316362 RepID=A0A4Q2DRB9_9AGAR|nr:hypothetical protein EST38_g3736 [Candolleomyces aberdarensis]